MSAATLSGLVLVAVALPLLGALDRLADARWPQRLPRLAGWLASACCAGAGGLVLVYLLGPAAPFRMVLPLGLPGAPAVLAIDALSAFFLLALLPVAGAAISASWAATGRIGWRLPALAAAQMLCLLAADSFSLMLGIAGVAMLTVPPRPGRTAWVAAASVLCLAAALAVAGNDPRFTELARHPPEGLRGTVMLGLVLVAGSLPAGMAPPGPALGAFGALRVGGMSRLGLYVLVRGLFDLAGPAQPPWWGLPLLAIGGLGALAGGWQAAKAATFDRVIAGVATAQAGLVLMALGAALVARGLDAGPLAGLALSAALFAALAHGWTLALLALLGGAVLAGAGSERLDRLGGLVHSMKLTTAVMLLAGWATASLPLGAGFAAIWLLVQTAIGAPLVTGQAGLLLAALAVAAVAAVTALLALAVLRLIGLGFLGRPRSPRAAAADEVPPAMRWVLLGLCFLVVTTGLAPGLVLGLAAPAVVALVGATAGSGLLVLPAMVPPGGPAPLLLLLLLMVASGGIWLALRRGATDGRRATPAWDGGQGSAPSWLPFGDPATQLGTGGFVPLPTPVLPARGWWRSVRQLTASGMAGPIALAATFLVFLLLAGLR